MRDFMLSCMTISKLVTKNVHCSFKDYAHVTADRKQASNLERGEALSQCESF